MTTLVNFFRDREDHEEDNGESHKDEEESHRVRVSCSLLNSNSTIQSLIDAAEAALVQAPQATQNIASALATINSATAPGSSTCPSICNPPGPSNQTGQQPAGTGDDDEEEHHGDNEQENTGDDDEDEHDDYKPKKCSVKFNFTTSDLDKFHEKLKSLLHINKHGGDYELCLTISHGKPKRVIQATGVAEIKATDEESAIAAVKAVQRSNDTDISSSVNLDSLTAVNENGEVFINNQKPYIIPVEKSSIGGIVVGLLIVVVGCISLLFVYNHTYKNKVDFHGASAASRNPEV